MTDLELKILRDVLANKREGGDRAHDAALISLVKRGLVSYAPHRERQKFTLTSDGRRALDLADSANMTKRFTGKPLLPWDAAKLKVNGSG